MKNSIYTLLLALTALFASSGAYGQGNDDIYFDGVEESKKKKEVIKEDPIVETDEYERAEDDYVDEDYEYEYTARVRRFHQPARGFSYYSNYYVDNYYYDPFMPGVNIYTVQPYYIHYNNGWGYPYCNSWGSNWGNSYGYGWSYYSGYSNFSYGYNPFAYGYNNYYGYGGYNQYWNGYNNGYWNGYQNGYWNGWYNQNHYHNNNNNNWFDNSAPNAGNFVTSRQPRSSDTELHRSRNTPVQGYDTHQRPNGVPNNTLTPDVKRTRDPNTTQPNNNVRPERNTIPPVRETDVRPDTRVRPTPNVRPNTNPPVIRETNPGRSGTLTPPNTIPERNRNNNNSLNNNSINNNSGGRNSGGFNSGSGSSGSPSRSTAPTSGSRSSGGRR
jgi:hypothetical protein